MNCLFFSDAFHLVVFPQQNTDINLIRAETLLTMSVAFQPKRYGVTPVIDFEGGLHSHRCFSMEWQVCRSSMLDDVRWMIHDASPRWILVAGSPGQAVRAPISRLQDSSRLEMTSSLTLGLPFQRLYVMKPIWPPFTVVIHHGRRRSFQLLGWITSAPHSENAVRK